MSRTWDVLIHSWSHNFSMQVFEFLIHGLTLVLYCLRTFCINPHCLWRLLLLLWMSLCPVPYDLNPVHNSVSSCLLSGDLWQFPIQSAFLGISHSTVCTIWDQPFLCFLSGIPVMSQSCWNPFYISNHLCFHDVPWQLLSPTPTGPFPSSPQSSFQPLGRQFLDHPRMSTVVTHAEPCSCSTSQAVSWNSQNSPVPTRTEGLCGIAFLLVPCVSRGGTFLFFLWDSARCHQLWEYLLSIKTEFHVFYPSTLKGQYWWIRSVHDSECLCWEAIF